jgi:catalase
MEPEQAVNYGRGLFDITKVWSHKEFPLIEVGKMTLNKNVRANFSYSLINCVLTHPARELFCRN